MFILKIKRKKDDIIFIKVCDYPEIETVHITVCSHICGLEYDNASSLTLLPLHSVFCSRDSIKEIFKIFYSMTLNLPITNKAVKKMRLQLI